MKKRLLAILIAIMLTLSVSVTVFIFTACSENQPSYIAVQLVSVSGRSTVFIDETIVFNVIILPNNATSQAVEWSLVDNDGGAVISDDGVFSAIKAATFTVAATVGGVSGTLSIVVSYPSPTHTIVSFVCYSDTDMPASQTIEIGSRAIRPINVPTRQNYFFRGWYANKNFTQEFDFNTNLATYTTIYARWIYIDYANFYICDFSNMLFGLTAQGKTQDFLVIPASVVEILHHAFFDSTTIAAIRFEQNSRLERIGVGAFARSSLKNIRIPAGVITIEAQAFLFTFDLYSITFEPNSRLRYIENAAFWLSGLTSIIIPASVTTIESWAFDGALALRTVIFESGSQLEFIGAGAFHSTAIRTIIIPASVTYMGQNIFGSLNHSELFNVFVVRHRSRPDGWHEYWLMHANSRVIWGL